MIPNDRQREEISKKRKLMNWEKREKNRIGESRGGGWESVFERILSYYLLIVVVMEWGGGTIISHPQYLISFFLFYYFYFFHYQLHCQHHCHSSIRNSRYIWKYLVSWNQSNGMRSSFHHLPCCFLLPTYWQDTQALRHKQKNGNGNGKRRPAVSVLYNSQPLFCFFHPGLFFAGPRGSKARLIPVPNVL